MFWGFGDISSLPFFFSRRGARKRAVVVDPISELKLRVYLRKQATNQSSSVQDNAIIHLQLLQYASVRELGATEILLYEEAASLALFPS